jgi:deazaflavin-dependent oxidoreductase (nitroreductase family)
MVGEIAHTKPNSYQKFIHRFLMLEPVSAFLAKILYRVDRFILYISRGHYTATQLAGLPIVQLTTIGAKTGQPRSMPLVGIFDGVTIALIATYFGSKHNPGWYYNLKAHPECEASYAGYTQKYIAREIIGEEYEHYWQLAISFYEGYEKYKQRAAHRHIPVMLLEPKG